MYKLRKIAASIGIAFVVSGPLLFASPASADTVSGLTQDVYTFSSEALPNRVPYTLCNSSVVPNLNFDVGGGVVANCQEDFVLIHWYGYITTPLQGEVTFNSLADDGFYMTIGDQVVIDNWWLKGCGGGSGVATFEPGVSQAIDVWWYEYGGGACNYLYYQDPASGLTLVPDSFFSTSAVTPAPVTPEPPVVVPPVDPVPVDPTPVDPPVDPTPVDPVPVDPTPVDPPVVPPVDPTPVDPPVVPPVDPVVPVPPIDPVPIDPGPGPAPETTPPVETPVVSPVEEPVAKPVEPEVQTPVDETPEPPKDPEVISLPADEIDPATLTEAQVEQLKEVAFEVLATAEPGSPEYQEALDKLWVAAEADDIELDPAIAAIPVLGNVAAALTDVINFAGNVGADMSPKVREDSKKIVVSAVVAAGAAISAASGAATAAASAASSSAGTSSRKIK